MDDPPATAMSRLYKYLPLKYARALTECGEVKIGTLHEYRDYERSDSARNDPEEGMARTIRRNINMSWKDPSQANVDPWLRRIVGIGGRDITIKNCDFSRTQYTKNCYIFCASAVFDLELMTEFRGCDACVEITDAGAFAAAIIESLGPQIDKRSHFCPCVYIAREQECPGPVAAPHPVYWKDPQFKHQEEWRVVFATTPEYMYEPHDSVILTLPKLTQNCFLRHPAVRSN